MIFLNRQQHGGGEGGGTNQRPGTDHVVLGPMRGLKQTAPDGANRYIALQGTTQESLPQVKLGKTLNLRLFGVRFDKNKGRSLKLVKILSIKQLRKKENSKEKPNTIKIKNITS